jgi:hypothetical protein
MPVLWIDVVEPAACGMDFIQGPSSFYDHDLFVPKTAIAVLHLSFTTWFLFDKIFIKLLYKKIQKIMEA